MANILEELNRVLDKYELNAEDGDIGLFKNELVEIYVRLLARSTPSAPTTKRRGKKASASTSPGASEKKSRTGNYYSSFYSICASVRKNLLAIEAAKTPELKAAAEAHAQEHDFVLEDDCSFHFNKPEKLAAGKEALLQTIEESEHLQSIETNSLLDLLRQLHSDEGFGPKMTVMTLTSIVWTFYCDQAVNDFLKSRFKPATSE